MGKGFLKKDQPRQSKTEKGDLRGAEGMQEQAGKARRNGRRLVEINHTTIAVDTWAEWIQNKEPRRGTSMEKLDTGGEEKKQGGQGETADPAEQPSATTLTSAAGEGPQATLTCHLPPFYHAIMATMKRQLKRIIAVAIITALTAARNTLVALVEETGPVKANRIRLQGRCPPRGCQSIRKAEPGRSWGLAFWVLRDGPFWYPE